MGINEVATIILGLLAIMVPILGMLVAALYKTIVKEQEASAKRFEEHVKESRNREIEILKQAEGVHNKLWDAVHKAEHNNFDTLSTHNTLCQKHEDNMQRLEDKIVVLESKIKGQESFFNARLSEVLKRNK